MRYTITIVFLLITSASFAQADSVSLKKAVADFNKALIAKDSIALKKLVHDKITYGHSNGWIQSKSDIIDDLYSGKIVYNVIDQYFDNIVLEGNTASVRETANINVEMAGKLLQFKLKVLQVWVWKKKGWQLFSRQSVKI
jgi:hypothetical protein